MDLISFTEFPPPERPMPTKIEEQKFLVLAELVGAADLIGQLADPMYDEKIVKEFAMSDNFLDTVEGHGTEQN